MICKLCLKEKKLCNSHVIPELLYKPMYDKKHRSIEVQLDPLVKRYRQKGLSERLLCTECEGQFNGYETYFANLWYHSDKRPRVVTEELVTIEGVDYTPFKLFHLSILWRASISSLTEFDQVSLGPHQERVRQLLLDEDPGARDQYGILARVLVDSNSGELLEGALQMPTKCKMNGHHAYEWIFGGCSWLHVVSRWIPQDKTRYLFGPDGRLYLLRWYWKDHKPLVEFVQKYRQFSNK